MYLALTILKIGIFFIGIGIIIISLLHGYTNKTKGYVKRALIIWGLVMLAEFIVVGIEFLIALNE